MMLPRGHREETTGEAFELCSLMDKRELRKPVRQRGNQDQMHRRSGSTPGGGGKVGTGCSQSRLEGAKGCDFMGMVLETSGKYQKWL